MERYCRNCGNKGHSYRECNNPILSFGIILYHTDEEDKTEIIMIERKDSLAFIEFIRGKYYNIYNHDYIQLIIDRMSTEEKQRLLENTFDELWTNLWLNTDNINYKIKREYSKSKVLFNNLKDRKDLNLKYFIDHSASNYTNNEWELPKGRRENYENNKECAIREVNEETNIKHEMYSLLDYITPINEEYTGINNVRYKHNYYMGKMKQRVDVYMNEENKDQQSEVRNIKWLTEEEGLNSIRDYDENKKSVIKYFFNLIKEIEKYGTLEE